MESKTKRKTYLIVNTILIAVGICFALYKLFTVKTIMQVLVAIVTLVIYLFTLLYVAYAYKRPKNNLLGYIMLLYAASLIFDLNFCIYLKAKHFFIVTCIVMLLVAYVAGRLDRIKKSRILCIIITVALAYLWFNTTKNLGSIVNTSASQLFLWITLCFAYNAHYVARQGLEENLSEQ